MDAGVDMTRNKRPRIALISATPLAIKPAVLGLEDKFPEAEVWNLLDDMLMPDVDAAGRLTPALVHRMERLIDHAVMGGADGVLLTCSMYGSVAKASRAPLPVMAPDEAAFAEIVSGPWEAVLVIASMAAALEDSVARLEEEMGKAQSRCRVFGVVPPGAADRARVDDFTGLAETIARTVESYPERVDAVLLAQYSLCPAAGKLADLIGRPVISGPQSAAMSLRNALKP